MDITRQYVKRYLKESILNQEDEETLEFRDLYVNGSAIDDKHRAMRYLDFHYEANPYRTILTVDSQLKKTGSYIVVSNNRYRASLFVNGKHIGGTLNEIENDCVIYKISVGKKRTLSEKDKLALKLGFDYFDVGSWGAPEYSAKLKFMKHFKIKDIAYDVGHDPKGKHVGRVSYNRSESVFYMFGFKI